MSRLFAVAVFLFSSVPAFAMPQFLQLYRSDPFRNPAIDGCITCHMSPQGGDARNVFGQAFESGGERITTMLRAQFPDRFVYPTSRVTDALIVHFSDPDKKQVVVESGGTKNLVDVDQRTVNGRPAAAPNAPAAPAAPLVTSSAPSEIPVDAYAREGAFFGSNIVNLPDGKPQKAGGIDFLIGHRFGQDVKAAGLGGLYGFDSGAAIAYGVRIGLTDRLSVSAHRTSFALSKTISLGSALQISRQGKTMPLTLQVRGSIDGKQNFGLYRKENNPQLFERQYSPVVQVVSTRTFNDRVSVALVPTFAFNTRDETRGEDVSGVAFGTQHNSTVALGIGTGIRILPTASLVGEYIPRLWGFKGSLDRSAVAIGIQKSTFRHTFELLISRVVALTPAQYSVQGNDKFRVGFNIYRKIR